MTAVKIDDIHSELYHSLAEKAKLHIYSDMAYYEYRDMVKAAVIAELKAENIQKAVEKHLRSF